MKKPLALPAVALALAGAGCGGDDSGATTTQTATPRQAVAEIAVVKHALDEALVAYEDGRPREAEEIVGDAYLEHFELVEGPLEERDASLNEKLEVLISTAIRDAIETGESPKRVESLIEQAEQDLDKAERELRG